MRFTIRTFQRKVPPLHPLSVGNPASAIRIQGTTFATNRMRNATCQALPFNACRRSPSSASLILACCSRSRTRAPTRLRPAPTPISGQVAKRIDSRDWVTNYEYADPRKRLTKVDYITSVSLRYRSAAPAASQRLLKMWVIESPKRRLRLTREGVSPVRQMALRFLWPFR